MTALLTLGLIGAIVVIGILCVVKIDPAHILLFSIALILTAVLMVMAHMNGLEFSLDKIGYGTGATGVVAAFIGIIRSIIKARREK